MTSDFTGDDSAAASPGDETAGAAPLRPARDAGPAAGDGGDGGDDGPRPARVA